MPGLARTARVVIAQRVFASRFLLGGTMLIWLSAISMALGAAPAPDRSAGSQLAICDVPHARRAYCYGAIMNAYDLVFPNQSPAIRDEDLGLSRSDPLDKPKFDLVIARYVRMVRETPSLRYADALPLLIVATQSVFGKRHWFD
jgi:hypothetical protein